MTCNDDDNENDSDYNDDDDDDNDDDARPALVAGVRIFLHVFVGTQSDETSSSYIHHINFQ